MFDFTILYLITIKKTRKNYRIYKIMFDFAINSPLQLLK